jgi:hypothetical protein
MIVSGCMPARRHVAAPNVPALGTPPQMQPPTAGLKTFDATIAARVNSRVNSGYGTFSLGTRFVGHLGF